MTIISKISKISKQALIKTSEKIEMRIASRNFPTNRELIEICTRENTPYTVLREGFGRRAGGEYYDWARKNKYRVFLNLEQENKDVPVREKIAARIRLVNWLREQGAEGGRIIKRWKLV